MRLTGGIISYSERRTIAQYEHKDCKIELAFAFAEGEPDVPAFLDAIQAEIRARCLTMLGLSAPALAKAAETPKAVKPVIPAVEPIKPKSLAEVDLLDDPAPAPKKRGPKPKVVAPVEDDIMDIPEDAIVDDISDLLGVKEITDKALTEAIVSRNKTMLATDKTFTPRMRTLIAEYTGKSGAAAALIPQEKREAFLAALAELK